MTPDQRARVERIAEMREQAARGLNRAFERTAYVKQIDRDRAAKLEADAEAIRAVLAENHELRGLVNVLKHPKESESMTLEQRERLERLAASVEFATESERQDIAPAIRAVLAELDRWKAFIRQHHNGYLPDFAEQCPASEYDGMVELIEEREGCEASAIKRLAAELDAARARLRRYEPEPGQCEHGIKEGEWCEPCNREYKEAAEAARSKT